MSYSFHYLSACLNSYITESIEKLHIYIIYWKSASNQQKKCAFGGSPSVVMTVVSKILSGKMHIVQEIHVKSRDSFRKRRDI